MNRQTIMTKQMRKLQRLLSKKGFTLVELIIVIAIVAILSVVAFMVVTKWIGKSKDTRRLADLGTMKRSLEVGLAENNYVPMPDGTVGTGQIGGIDQAYVGVYGENIVKTLKSIKSAPFDPTANTNYGYGIDVAKKKYQVAVVLEDGSIVTELTNAAYAGTPQARVEGNYGLNDIYQISTNGSILVAVPSLIFTGTSPVNLGSSGTVNYIVNNGNNLPYLVAGVSNTISDNAITSLKTAIGFDNSAMTDVKVDLTAGDSTSRVTALAGIVPNKEILSVVVNKVNASTGVVLMNTNAVSSAVISGTVMNTAISNGNSLSSSSSTSSGGGSAPINGVCGGNNGQSLKTLPTTNLCGAGTASAVTDNGIGSNYMWSCIGVNSGSTANCSANHIVDSSWCNNSYGSNTYNNEWDVNNELGYHNNKCYIFGDENDDAIAACNKWMTDNTTLGGTWIWTPARWFVTDGNGKGMKDSFYERQVTYNGHDYICRGFAVMKYEAKFSNTTGKSQPNASWGTWAVSDYSTDNDTYSMTVVGGGVVSKASDYPIGSIRQGEAIAACGTGGTYHLITNNEWMAVARNIEQQGSNWTSGTVGNGGLYIGNVNLTDNMSYSSYGISSKYTDGAGNDSESRGTNQMGNRYHILSNGSKVWDISGNGWEHVNKANNPATTNVRGDLTNGYDNNVFSTEAMCTESGRGWRGWYGTDVSGVVSCTFKTGYSKDKYGPSGNWNADNGLGRIYAKNVQDRNNIFARGGSGDYGTVAGIFALGLDRDPSTQRNDLSFRCVR